MIEKSPHGLTRSKLERSSTVQMLQPVGESGRTLVASMLNEEEHLQHRPTGEPLVDRITVQVRAAPGDNDSSSSSDSDSDSSRGPLSPEASNPSAPRSRLPSEMSQSNRSSNRQPSVEDSDEKTEAVEGAGIVGTNFPEESDGSTSSDDELNDDEIDAPGYIARIDNERVSPPSNVADESGMEDGEENGDDNNWQLIEEDEQLEIMEDIQMEIERTRAERIEKPPSFYREKKRRPAGKELASLALGDVAARYVNPYWASYVYSYFTSFFY